MPIKTTPTTEQESLIEPLVFELEAVRESESLEHLSHNPGR